MWTRSGVDQEGWVPGNNGIVIRIAIVEQRRRKLDQVVLDLTFGRDARGTEIGLSAQSEAGKRGTRARHPMVL